MNWTIEGKKTKFFSETVVWSNKPISRNFYIHIKRSAGLGHPLRKKSIILHLGEIWTNRFGGIKIIAKRLLVCLTITAIALHYYTISGSLLNEWIWCYLIFFFAIWTTFTTNQIVGKRSPPMVKINKDFFVFFFFYMAKRVVSKSQLALHTVTRPTHFSWCWDNSREKFFLVYLSDQPLIGRFSTEIFRHFFQIVSTDGVIGKKYTFIHDIEYLQHVIRSVRHVCANRFI
jgi:hypothetical protein